MNVSGVLQSAIDFLGSTEVSDFILPFLLIYILVFTILGRIKLFGEKRQKMNGLIAIVVALLSVRQGTLVEFINQYLPNVSVVLVVFLGILILLGLFGFGSHRLKGGVMLVFVLVSLGGGIWALMNATTQGEVEIPLIHQEISEEDAGVLLVVGAFLLLMLFSGYKPLKRGPEGFLDAMGKMGDKFAGVSE